MKRLVAAALLIVIALAGCSTPGPTEQAPAGAPAEGWPRTVETERGPVELTAAPKRIVSTSVTITGTLLAIDAPVVASGATGPNTYLSDDQGFFRQWSEVAQQRGVQRLYDQSAPSVEAVLAQQPDLIIVSKSGADSAADLYDQLSKIAPTLVLGYDDKSWQDLATLLGDATGHEADARQAIEDYRTKLAETRAAITLPEQPTSAFVFATDAGVSANVWTAESAQAVLLRDVGFTLAEVPADLRTTRAGRKDVINIAEENLERGLAGRTWILIAPGPTTEDQVRRHPLLAGTDAVRNDRVYAMGADSFRLDYYSAGNLLDRLREQLG
ncbi:Fe2+-enterobactin ABC transporter substrate-binding protein [Microlunatus sp. GCM10028923]|uniref:Fe2+-enterobactin ABC transporter substrate-binding protein n=1 Tax=Microlunatus sp. GCM10028923 TaxID=3273400 RepID=UPI003607228C